MLSARIVRRSVRCTRSIVGGRSILRNDLTDLAPRCLSSASKSEPQPLAFPRFTSETDPDDDDKKKKKNNNNKKKKNSQSHHDHRPTPSVASVASASSSVASNETSIRSLVFQPDLFFAEGRKGHDTRLFSSSSSSSSSSSMEALRLPREYSGIVFQSPSLDLYRRSSRLEYHGLIEPFIASHRRVALKALSTRTETSSSSSSSSSSSISAPSVPPSPSPSPSPPPSPPSPVEIVSSNVSPPSRGLAPRSQSQSQSQSQSLSADASASRRAERRPPRAVLASAPQSEVDARVKGKSTIQEIRETVWSATKTIAIFLYGIPGAMIYYLTHPGELRERLAEFREAFVKEAHHYWMGTKLLFAEVQTAWKMLSRTLSGSTLTRRERKQLLRTVSDIFRLVPFSMFILIPFMEFALPFALRLFPNMLPSTFQDSLKAEENMKRELQSRIAMAQFFQETLQDLLREQKKQAAEQKEEALTTEGADGDDECVATKQEESAAAMLEFLEKARNGEMIPPDVIIQYATYFQDDLTLENMPRMQLVNMCMYMSIPPYGSDAFLRFQLRHRIRSLKEDDQRILWEGIDSLTKMELREACQERGMRSTGLSKDGYKKLLQQWLNLSVSQKVPIFLLIMSRTFFLREDIFARGPADEESMNISGLADAISGLDKDVVNEVVLQVATAEEKRSDLSVARIKLEVIEAQNERILEEQMEREAATKKKEERERGIEELREEEPVPGEADEQSADAAAGTGIEAATEDPSTSATLESAVPAGAPEEVVPAESTAESKGEGGGGGGEEEEEAELSTHEIDAISQWVNPDPVNKEREELARIKAAMEEPAGVSEETVAPAVEGKDPAEIPEPSVLDEQSELQTDADAKRVIEEMDARAEEESRAGTTSSFDQEVRDAELSTSDEPETSGNERLDKAIERLKSRVSSMVERIETRLSEVHGKIGDKLHFLDKDNDGVLTREEMADALQRVLKRKLSQEEAMDIAELMDENKDGFFTVAELKEWLETNKIVKLLEEGKDADIDRIMEQKSSEEEEEDAVDTTKKE